MRSQNASIRYAIICLSRNEQTIIIRTNYNIDLRFIFDLRERIIQRTYTHIGRYNRFLFQEHLK